MNFTCTFYALSCLTNDRMSRLLLVVGFSLATKTQMQLFTCISLTFGKKNPQQTIDLDLTTMKTKEVGQISTQLNLPILSSEVQILNR